MKIVDLHVHSVKSDGSYTPTELVDYALEKGLSAFALTDHDTIEGLKEAMEYSSDKNIEVIPGIELSTEYLGRDVHIVGLYIDPENDAFLSHLKRFRDSRDERNEKMCNNLREAGIDITFEKLKAENPGAVITRSHYARYLLDHGYITSLPEAFDKYVGDHCKYFVPREKITPKDAVALILEAGGIPVLAHPILYHLKDRVLDELVKELKSAGLVGIEAIYSSYSPSEERQIRELASKYNLAISGGTDFHGKAKPGLDLATGYGKLCIPYEVLAGLRKHLKATKIFFTDLDNTLLTTDKKITKKTRAVLDSWLERGNYIAFSSGRPLNSILQVLEANEFNHEHIYAIGYNGALIYHVASKTKIVEKTLPLDTVNKIYDVALENDVYIHTYDDDSIIAPRAGEELAFYRQTVKLPYSVMDDFPHSLIKEPCKMLGVDPSESGRLQVFAKKLEESGIPGLVTVMSNPKLLEVFSDKSGKGSAVTELCNMLNINIRDSIAAGDEQNDISMLEAAGLGIAMCNGRDIVKEAGDVVTEYDNNNDGLVPFLE